MQPVRIAIAMHSRKIPVSQGIAMVEADLIDVAIDFVHHLVIGDYEYSNGLGLLDSGVLVSPDYIALFLADSGVTLIDPPATAFVLGPPYAGGVKCRGVTANLWTVEEEESSLRLDLD